MKRFPIFSLSWTLLTIWLKIVDPFDKTSIQVVSTRKYHHWLSAVHAKNYDCFMELIT